MKLQENKVCDLLNCKAKFKFCILAILQKELRDKVIGPLKSWTQVEFPRMDAEIQKVGFFLSFYSTPISIYSFIRARINIIKQKRPFTSMSIFYLFLQ